MNRQKDNGASLVIGVDFDNTIAIYDELFHRVALERGLIEPDVWKSKLEIRDAIHLLPGGEIEWQRLQGTVYGPRMREAQLTGGITAFLASCRRHGVKVFIVSHKTELANYDATQTNLRQSAMSWMDDSNFFGLDGVGLSKKDVFFEDTRREKLKRIESQGCTHFIDDLEEVFLDGGFPRSVRKILYNPHRSAVRVTGITTAASWEEISELLFGSNQMTSEVSLQEILGKGIL